MAAVGTAGADAIFIPPPSPWLLTRQRREPPDAQWRSTGGSNRSGIYERKLENAEPSD
jgi:hypothetical protein